MPQNALSFDPSSGARFYRGATEIWTSNQLHPIHYETVSGSFTINLAQDAGARQVPIAVNERRVLRTGLSTLLTHVDGTAKAAWSGGPYLTYGVVDGSYHNIGGTIFLFFRNERIAPSNTYVTSLSGILVPGTAIAMTFGVDGGNFFVDVERYIPGYSVNSPLPGGTGTMTINYVAYLSTLQF